MVLAFRMVLVSVMVLSVSLCHGVSLCYVTFARVTRLSVQRAQRTKSRGPKGLQLEVRARRIPRLQVNKYIFWVKFQIFRTNGISYFKYECFQRKNHEGYLFIFTVTIRRMRGHWNEVCLGLKQVTEYFLDLLWLTGRWQGHWSEVSSLYNSLVYFLGFSKRDINISCDKTRLSSKVFGFTTKQLLDFLRLTRKMREHWSEVSWNSAPLLWKLALCAQQTSILLSDANIQRYLENILNTFLSLRLHIFLNLCIPRNCKMSQSKILLICTPRNVYVYILKDNDCSIFLDSSSRRYGTNFPGGQPGKIWYFHQNTMIAQGTDVGIR